MSNDLKAGGGFELLLWLIRRRQRFRVKGDSMLPLLKSGDEVLVNPRAYRHTLPQPGDIVIARHPYRKNVRLIKRVISITENNRYILRGDNPSSSTDSAAFGSIAIEQIVGQVTGRFL